MDIKLITLPTCFEGESLLIEKLFALGLPSLHVRKPALSQDQLALFLMSLPKKYGSKIVIHDHYSLVSELGLQGVHLNERNRAISFAEPHSLSKSCHRIEELERIDTFQYVFLSPIFDSISKEGYSSAFRYEDLKEAADLGWINKKVYALGGVDREKIPLLRCLGFGGVGLIGAIWGKVSEDLDFQAVLDRYSNLYSLLKRG